MSLLEKATMKKKSFEPKPFNEHSLTRTLKGDHHKKKFNIKQIFVFSKNILIISIKCFNHIKYERDS